MSDNLTVIIALIILAVFLLGYWMGSKSGECHPQEEPVKAPVKVNKVLAKRSIGMKKTIFILLFALLLPTSAFAGSKEDVEKRLYLLNKSPWIQSYQVGVFDCSNMSALLKVYFSDYKTRIYVGVGHAVLGIYIDNKWYLIESTVLTFFEDMPVFKDMPVLKDMPVFEISYGYENQPQRNDEHCLKEYYLAEDFLEKNKWVYDYFSKEQLKPIIKNSVIYVAEAPFGGPGWKVRGKMFSSRPEAENYLTLLPN